MIRRGIDTEAYLRRIGLAARPSVDEEGLRQLQVAHLQSVPFENLDIVAGRPLSLDLGALHAKVIGARRGGFCYELNGLLAVLLEDLGFRVARLAAETWSQDSDSWGPPMDHLVLRVDLDRPWLVDVGFGDAFREPLRLVDGAEQADPGGATFGLSPVDGRWLLWKRFPGANGQTPLFRFDEEPHQLADFVPMCHWQETESPFFVGHRIVERLTPRGRSVLYDDRLITHVGTNRSERNVPEPEIRSVLKQVFGIETSVEKGARV